MHRGFASEEPSERLAVSEYRVPVDIWLDGGRLYWPVKTNMYRFVRPTNETFSQFIDLANATDPEVLEYAKRWGMLFLCKQHLTPAGHNLDCEPLQGRGRSEIHEEGEPVKAWKLWAQQARSILYISQKLDDNLLGKSEDWQILYGTGYGYGPLRLPWHYPDYQERYSEKKEIKKRNAEKTDIAHLINEWLAASGVRPNMEWQSRIPLITLSGYGLFGALAVHLLELSGRYVLAGCSECHKFYHPTRRPKATQRRYCPDCVEAGIPLLRASQWRNLRKQEENQKSAKKR